MNLIFFNGKIMTMKHPTDIHTAIAISGNQIYAIGSDDNILSLQTKESQIIDLKGKMMLPGFNDSHLHLMGYGMALNQVDLSNAKSIHEVITMTKQFIEDYNIEKNTWVYGRGWNQDHFPVSNMPSHHDLDNISNEHYICLRRVCGHVASINSHALQFLNLSTTYTKVDGGEYYDGIFKENAYDLIMEQLPDPTIEDMKKWIQIGCKKLHQYGITSVQSDDLCVFPEQLSHTIFQAFETLAADGELCLNVYEQSLFRNQSNLNKFIHNGYQQNISIGTFKYGPLKILGDGSLGGRTAWLKDGYNDGDTVGIHMYSQSELDAFILMGQKNNIASAVHCIGDAMLDSALDSIEKAQMQYPNPNLRHGIVHCQITRPNQLIRMKELGILAYVQPIFLDYDLHIVEDRVGKELSNSSYNWKTMLDLGIPLAFGSDAPVETPNPIKGIHCAVHRQDLKYRPRDGYLKTQCLTVFEALKAYTSGSAYASHDDEHKGFLLPGYDADLVILSGDLFTDILETTVEMTIFHGKIVYQKN